MTSTPITPANPATLFKSPVRAVWNVQGENVPTLWWPAKGQLTTKTPKGTEQPVNTVLFMIPGTFTYTHTRASFQLIGLPLHPLILELFAIFFVLANDCCQNTVRFTQLKPQPG